MHETDQKFNIICLSNQLWDFPAWTNKRHVMGRLAAYGHNVLFVDPPINMGRLFFKQLYSGRWLISRLFTLQYTDSLVRVFTPLNAIYCSSLMSSIYSGAINFISRKRFDPSRKTILWVYHVEIPSLKNYIEKIKHDFLIYDCVDNYPGFPRYESTEKEAWINRQEKYLAGEADLIFASAPGLVDKLKSYSNSAGSNVFYTPNVGDYEKFKHISELKDKIPEDLKQIPRPIIGFTGALDDYKFDKELFKKVVTDNPNFSFVLIGPLALKDKEADLKSLGLDGFKNVYLLGTRHYSIIQNYFAGFDCFIIPYKLNNYTVGGCFPVKFHDSLAAGLPTVVTDLPAYYPFKNVCYLSKNYDEFEGNIKKALSENSPKKIKERQDVASENTWEIKVDFMLKCLKTAINA